tara:strand:- start:892 stop:1296 length:405 start_codon:yes stop_codon:yes gene_type:complete
VFLLLHGAVVGHTTDIINIKMQKILMKEEKNRQFETGAQRDTDEGKLRMSLIPHDELKRVMKRYLDGAEKYGENNWMKGMPLSVFYDCAHRHLEAWWRGENTEDHAAAVVWNMLCAMYTEMNVNDLDDREKFPH